MAAAEYFSSAPMHSQSQTPYQNQNLRPQAQTYNSQPYYPPPPNQNTNQPPPYTLQAQQQSPKPGVHFAPSPAPQRHSFSGQNRPSITYPPQQAWQHQMQPRPYGSPQNSASNMNLQLQQQPHHNHPPPQNPNYLSPHVGPYAQSNMSSNSVGSGYSSDPEGGRRRRHKHSGRSSRDIHESRDLPKHSRGRNTDAFLGAAGGGLIGDLIMPGLGTVGGAALGWLGGKDYGRRRKEREDERADAQREWEDKYGHNGSHSHHSHKHGPRSRGNSYGSDIYNDERNRRRSADERDRRDEYYR